MVREVKRITVLNWEGITGMAQDYYNNELEVGNIVELKENNLISGKIVKVLSGNRVCFVYNKSTYTLSGTSVIKVQHITT